ncbi:cyclic nucleotide-binding domain-containing protein [Blastococcus sp. URHD0036]|uniref:cyclic nucleotide-binding domain-containing protein n=1 Tax=Blastococcus sp. URHD0036 TaxID=1380356 RepID=UPI0012DF17BF|nr:cyclic nucleotide-binding domain-containing protein [Blastococcus sp. URHD0036]
MRAVLRAAGEIAGNRGLARLLGAYGVFTATENAVWIAMLVYAYARGGAPLTGAVAVAQLVPAAVAAPLVAALADRFSARRVLVGGYAVQVAGMLAAAVAMALDAAPVAYAGAVLASTAVATTRPAQTVLLPGLVRSAAELTSVNAAIGWLESAGAVAASVATGILLAVAAPEAVFAGAAVAGVASVVLAALVPASAVPVDVGPGGLRATLAGVAVLARQPAPRLLGALLTAQWVLIGALDLLFVVLAVDVLGRGDDWVGWLNTAYAAGGVVAGMAGIALLGRRRLAPVVLGSVAVIGLALALAAPASAAAVTLVLMAAVGGGHVVFSVATRSLLQRAVPADVVGRVFGAVEGLAMAGLAVGAAAVPVLVEAGGPALALLVTAAVLPVVALCGGRLLLRLDAAADVPVVDIALLRSLPVFATLPAPAVEGLARSADRVDLAAGAVLVREGEEGDHFYAVVDGRLAVTVGGAPAGAMCRGDGLGEIALLRDLPRTATVTADVPTVVLALGRDAFLAAVTAHPPAARVAAAVSDRRLESDRRRVGAESAPGPASR